MQDNCNNIHIKIPTHKRSSHSYHQQISQQLHKYHPKSNNQCPHFQKQIFHMEGQAKGQYQNIKKTSLEKEDLDSDKQVIIYDKNWQRKNSKKMTASRNQSHPQLHIDLANKQVQHEQGSNNIKSRQKQKNRKMSEQLAKNQLLSIDTSQKKHSKKSMGGFIVYNKNIQTILTNNINKKIKKKTSFHNSRFQKSTINKDCEQKHLQQVKVQGSINKIDINKIYLDHNSRKNSSAQSFKKNHQPQSQQNQKQTNNSQFTYTHIQTHLNLLQNPNQFKNQLSHKHEHGNKSLSNFQLLKLHAEQLQKSNIVLGSKQKISIQSNRKIYVKQFIKNCPEQSDANLNLNISTKPSTNHACHSTHRSKYKQTLTNRKLTYDNCHIDAGKIIRGHHRKGSKIMNVTLDNMKKYNNSNCDICRLNTEPSMRYADTSIFQSRHNNDENWQEKKKSIHTHKKLSQNSKIYVQNNQNKQKKQLSQQLQKGSCQLPQTLTNRGKCSLKNQLQNTHTSQHQNKFNQSNRLITHNQNGVQNIERSRRIKTQVNIQNKNQEMDLSYLLLQQNDGKYEDHNMLQGLGNYKGNNPNHRQSYSQAFIQNTANNKIAASNVYVINNQFVPLVNRSVLDKNRHNIKKISKNINRIFSNKNQNKKLIAGMENNNERETNSSIEQFMKNKLSLIELSSNMENMQGKVNYKNILYENNNKSIEKTIFHDQTSVEKSKPKQNKCKSISQPSLIVQKQSKIQKSETTNAARFYRNQLQKCKDKANIIYLDPFLKAKAIQLQNNHQLHNHNHNKSANDDIVIICL